jgi:1-acyl-sn-glycerol-3-phosphate acyltransferase
MRDLLQAAFFLVIVKPFLRLFIGLRVAGLENLPARDPFVLIANHSSHLDTVSLLSLFPVRRLRKIRPAAASDYFERTALIAWFSHTFINILPIARKHITKEDHPILKMRQALESGESLILFPEGTRGHGETPGPFQPGIAHLVDQLPGLSVVPCYLANMGRALPKGEFVPVPFFCEIRIGKPLRPEGNREEILAALRSEVLALRDAALQAQAQ